MKEIKLTTFCAILSLVNLVGFNIPFLMYACHHTDKWFLIASLIVVLAVVNFAACYLICYLFRRVGRVLVAICHLISTIATYYVILYNTMMDDQMIASFFNTKMEEAAPFITLPFLACAIIIGVLPMIWIIVAKVNYGSWKRFGAYVGGALAITLGFVGCNVNETLWIGEHDTELGGLIMPWSYIVNTCRHFIQKKNANAKEIPLPDATFSNNEKRAVVLVIGESARRANCSLYGYERETNPCLSKEDSLHVIMAQSCDTYTIASVKCILECKPSKDLYEILPNYLYRTGAMVQWRTTNWGEPPIHGPEYLKREDLKHAEKVEDDDYDEVLLNGLKETIEGSDKDKVLIVLHTSTNHGPAYSHHYPPRFETYTPVCDNVEDAAKRPQDLINAYDNTIIYTDHLLSEVIDTLKTINDRSCAMIYISDHGESLGENNIYMHGIPLNIAPREQYEVPCFVWVSNGYRSLKEPDMIDQHWIFHSVLDLLDVDSPVYDPEKDLFK